MGFQGSYRRSNFLSFISSALILFVANFADGQFTAALGAAEGDVAAAIARLHSAESCGDEAGDSLKRIARLDPEKIRFTQSTYSESGKTEDGAEYTVEENAQWLREHPDQDFPWSGPIRVFRKEAFMDEWGPMTRFGYTGDSKNLINGEIYTLDHRRLLAYRRAGRKSIPVEWADLNIVRDQRWKFTTTTGGFFITPTPRDAGPGSASAYVTFLYPFYKSMTLVQVE
jgi:hypothetical protein